MIETDVIIVGGGPVGLGASIQLSRLGVRHVVIERTTSVSPHPKSRLLNPRSTEMMRSWGLEEAVLDVGIGIEPKFFFGKDLVSGWDQVFEPASTMKDETTLALSPCAVAGMLVSQDVLEPILRKAAITYDLADVRFGWEADLPIEDEEGLSVRVVEIATGREEIVRAPWLIAADGAGGALRRHCGVGTTGADRSLEAISVLFRSDLTTLVDSPAAFFALCNPDTIGTAVIAPVDADGRAALLGRPKIMDEQPLDQIDWLAELRKAVGAPDHPFEIIDVRAWRAAVAVAQSYRAGRIFFAGDAAHLMPPNGGFNMNTGLQDIHNLCWKLAGVLAGWADESLLDTYDAERRPIALYNAAEAVRNLKTLIDKDETGRAAMFRRDHYVHPGLALGYRYTDGAIAFEADQSRADDWEVGVYHPSAQPGARAPHLWLDEDGDTSLLDLFGRDFVLLAASDPDGAWAAAAAQAAESSGAPIQVEVVGSLARPNPDGQDFCALYGVSVDGAVLVRPDGHVGWRGRTAADAGNLSAGLKVQLHAPESARAAA
jgi:putative polyketide hydroxylase